MPDESYYPDPESGNTEPAESDDSDESKGETALLPKSLLAGSDFKVGDEITVKIEHIYEDEVEVSYTKAKEEEPSAMENASGSLDEMAGMMKG